MTIGATKIRAMADKADVDAAGQEEPQALPDDVASASAEAEAVATCET